MNNAFRRKSFPPVLFLILFSNFLWAQKIPVAQKQKNEPKYTIDLYAAYKNAKTYPLSTVAESVEYIPLETTNECLLGNISNIIITPNNFFVYVYEGLCYRFNREGKFLNSIGKIGNGPGECMRTRDAAVDTVNQWVYILDYDKIVKYDYSGNFLKSYKPGTEGSLGGFKILTVKPDLLLIGNISYVHDKPSKRFSFNFFSERQKDYVSKIACEKRDEIPFCINMPSMYNYRQNTFINDAWSDTIYKVKDIQNLQTYALIDPGKFKYRNADDNSILSGKRNNGDEWIIDKSMMVESDRFIFLRTNKGLFFYDKNQKETKCAEFIRSGKTWGHFVNDDLSSCKNKLQLYMTSFIKDNILVLFNNAYEFFEEGIDTTNPKIKKIMQNLKPGDNPVLVLVKLKK